MATLGQNKSRNVLRGLSSFWSRFFKDKEFLETFYGATDQLMGQVYLELMELLLANSIRDVPIFSKEAWKLLTFNSSEATIVGTEYRFLLTEKIKGLPFLYNKIFDPSIILEDGKDYYLSGNYIFFYKNIFDDMEYPGIAKRKSGTATVASIWAPEAEVDKEYIYEQYGRMLNIYEPSSEAYKSFIRGVWFYYMSGPTINRITSALNLIGGYPIASEDDELVLSIKEVNGVNFIKTTVTVYEINSDIGLDIAVGDRLRAFQYLTTAYTVTDYIDNPNWFDHIVVPIEVIPNLSVADRTTNRYDPRIIFIGYPIVIGYPGWKIGFGGLPNYMWLFFNQVLKYNIFYVTYNALASRFFRSSNDLTGIVLSGKPAFDLALVVPYLGITDRVDSENTAETLNIEIDYLLYDICDSAGTQELFAIEIEDLCTDDLMTATVETFLMEWDFTLSDTNTLPTELLTTEVEYGMTTDTYPSSATIEALVAQIDFSMDDSYGGVMVGYNSQFTQIGYGKIGDNTFRYLSGVVSRIGYDTMGIPEDGLYTEFPIIVQVI